MTADTSSPALGRLVRALAALDYGTPLLTRALGREGYAEALAGNPGAALWHLDRNGTRDGATDSPAADAGRASLLTRAFFLREPVQESSLSGLLGDDLVRELLECAALVPAEDGQVHSDVDVRPVDVDLHGSADTADTADTVLVVSDPDASLEIRTPGAEHVPGVGQAPLTLLNQVPSTPAERLLDLGTGSGVLALVLPADTTVATDIHERALGYARASHRSAPDRNVDWRQGSWFEPVTGESFDRIVSNPPFVVGPPEDGQVYRDSGLELDDATRTVVHGAAAHLAAGGTAHLLGAWATSLTESPASRVAGWIPAEGIRAWVVQRDEVSPSVYVRTWTADASVDLRSPAGRARTSRWLDYFAAHDVTSVGMGYIHLQRIDGPSEVTFEVVNTPDLGYFGDEVAEYFLRAQWLADRDSEDILDSRFQVRPGLARENVELSRADGGEPVEPGFRPEVQRLTRTDGPGFSHVVDAPLSAVVAGLSRDGLSLRDTAGLYCAVNDLDEEEFYPALVPLVVDLVRHGMILPADLVDREEEQ